MYNEVSSAHQSVHWKPTKTFQERQSIAAQGGVVGSDHEKGSVGHNGVEPSTDHQEAVRGDQRV